MNRPSALVIACLLVTACDESGTAVPQDPGPAVGEPACKGFELLGDKARDLRTGLVWDRYVELSHATADEADALCAAKGGRLPTREELLAMRKPASAGGDACALPACPFKGDRCATLQCGSAVPGNDARWGVAFSGGALVMVPSGQAEALVCVR